MTKIPAKFSKKIKDFKEFVEKETNTQVEFKDKKQDFEDIQRVSGYSKVQLETVFKIGKAFLFQSDNSKDRNRLVVMDFLSYTPRTHDNLIAHELGHIVIQMEFGKVFSITDSDLAFEADNILTDWQVDNYIQKKEFEIATQLNEIFTEYIKRLKNSEELEPIYLVQALVSDQLNKKIKEEFVQVYKERGCYLQESALATEDAEKINSAKSNYTKETHQELIKMWMGNVQYKIVTY